MSPDLNPIEHLWGILKRQVEHHSPSRIKSLKEVILEDWKKIDLAKKITLSNLLGFSAQGALVRSRFQNVVKMDAPSHFFFALERKNGQKRLMHSLRDNTGQILHESAEIRKCAVGFYETLFKKESQEIPEVAQSFYEGLPQVSEETNIEPGGLISEAELYTALQSLESGKAPGMDGLPVDFYKVFWKEISKDLSLVLMNSL